KFTDSFFKTRRSKEYREKAVAFDPYMNEPSYVGFEDITFRLMDSTTGKTLWTREFKNEAPQYIFDTAHDVLTFYWRANQKAAKKIIDDDPKLKQASKREEFSDYDIVVEAVDTASGHVRDRVLIYTGEGSFTPRAVWASGKYLTVVD